MPPGCVTICCCCHHALHQAMQTKRLLAHPAASIFQPSRMPGIVAVRRLQSAERTSLRVALLNTLANCIYYNPSLALAAMQQKEQRLLPIFATWSEVQPTLCNLCLSAHMVVPHVRLTSPLHHMTASGQPHRIQHPLAGCVKQRRAMP